jgi:hypothetical protein
MREAQAAQIRALFSRQAKVSEETNRLAIADARAEGSRTAIKKLAELSWLIFRVALLAAMVGAGGTGAYEAIKLLTK